MRSHGSLCMAVLALLGWCIPGLAQRYGDVVEPRPGELSAEAAKSRVDAFLRAVGLAPFTKRVDAELRLTAVRKSGARDREWSVEQYSGSYGKYTAHVDPRDGRILWFRNYTKEYEQVKGLWRTGTTFYKSMAEAKAHLWRLGRAIGLPPDAEMIGIRAYGDNTPGKGDANQAGSLGCTFGVYPTGDRSIEPMWIQTVSVDPQDGVVTHVWQRPTWVLESGERNVSREEAIRAARLVYVADAKRFRSHSDPWPLDAEKVRLFFGGLVRIRLMWHVPFGGVDPWGNEVHDSVSVDAATGKVFHVAIVKYAGPTPRPARRGVSASKSIPQRKAGIPSKSAPPSQRR